MKTFNNTTIKKVIVHLKENYKIELQPILDEETNLPIKNNYSFINCNIYECKYCGIFISPQELRLECHGLSDVDMIVMIPSGFVAAEDLLATIDDKLKHYLTSALLRVYQIKKIFD